MPPSSMKGFHTYNAVNVNSPSVLYNEYTIGHSVIVPLGEACMETGKYFTTPTNLNINYLYGIGSANHNIAYNLTATPSTDTFTKKIGGSRFIDDLISNNANNLYTNQIVSNNSSMSYANTLLCLPLNPTPPEPLQMLILQVLSLNLSVPIYSRSRSIQIHSLIYRI